jgi:hypothetical protein
MSTKIIEISNLKLFNRPPKSKVDTTSKRDSINDGDHNTSLQSFMRLEQQLQSEGDNIPMSLSDHPIKEEPVPEKDPSEHIQPADPIVTLKYNTDQSDKSMFSLKKDGTSTRGSSFAKCHHSKINHFKKVDRKYNP